MNVTEISNIAAFINTKYSFKAPLPLGERVWGEGGVPHGNEKSYTVIPARAGIQASSLWFNRDNLSQKSPKQAIISLPCRQVQTCAQ